MFLNKKQKIMIRNYFKIAWRNLLKNKVYSFINIGGLAVGMAVAMLIGLWINYEFSFGAEHRNRSQIFSAVTNGIDPNDKEKFTSKATPLPLYIVSKNTIPEIKHTAVANWGGENGLVVGDKKLIKNGTEVSEDFFKIFKYDFIVGDPNSALNEPNTIVLTEETALDLFGTADALNKVLKWNNTTDLKVTGVIHNVSKNSFFSEKQYFLPFKNFENRESWVKVARTDWGNYSFQTYIELIPEATEADILPKIKNLIKSNDKTSKNEIGLYGMPKWRLYSEFKNWKADSGRITYVRMFGFIGLIVLLLACVNFINLSTARSEKRAKEIGVRKAVGSAKKQLMGQFLIESILISSISIIISLILLLILLSAFNSIVNVNVELPYQNPIFWLVAVGLALTTGLIAGIYPAFYLSTFSSINALKGRLRVANSTVNSRKILVVTQFASSICLIIGTIIIYKQITYSKNRPTGYNSNGVVTVFMKDDLYRNFEILKNNLIATGLIENVTKASNPINSIWSNTSIIDFPGKSGNDEVSVANIATSGDYFKTLQIKMLEGRDFNSLNFAADSGKVILNRAAVDRMKLKDPIGKIITDYDRNRHEIIGVVENAIMDNPFENVKPARFLCNKDWASVIMLRIKDNVDTKKAISAMTPIFNKHNPSFPFVYNFVDQEYAAKFNFEVMVSKLATIFAILAIFISCLGLFGLASFVAEQRTKEIGIRKVLGASVNNLWQLLSKDFVILVIISCLIATPIAYYFMHEWLQKYTYRTEISWWIFVAAGLGALVITLLTVSYQAVKAALMNPVKSLKTE
jgi:putative ABC transport system permease protein